MTENAEALYENNWRNGAIGILKVEFPLTISSFVVYLTKDIYSCTWIKKKS